MPNPETALAQAPRLDVRRRRADAVLNRVWQIARDFIPPCCQRETFDRLQGLLADEGVEVLTDYDRARAGLPARGPDGWTLPETLALEAHRLQVMTSIQAPGPTPLVLTLGPKGYRLEDPDQQQQLMAEEDPQISLGRFLGFLAGFGRGGRPIIIKQEQDRT